MEKVLRYSCGAGDGMYDDKEGYYVEFTAFKNLEEKYNSLLNKVSRLENSHQEIPKNLTEAKNVMLQSIKDGKHKQFKLDTKYGYVVCKCGHKAIWWQDGYVCGSITAYPCKYN